MTLPTSSASPLEEATGPSFDQLINSPRMLAALQEQQITHATPVQAQTIPHAIAGKDLVVQAQTGSGKTLAFILPLLSNIQRDRTKTEILVLAPTRELALQIQNVVKSVVPTMICPCIIGGRKESLNMQELREDSRLVVGTPGRVLDMLERRAFNLDSCRAFVLDEADEMLGIGFLEDVTAILSKVPAARQGLLFSATITPRVQSLARKFLKEPLQIIIPALKDSAPEIEHLFCRVDGSLTSKALAVYRIIEDENPSSVLVFCNSKSDTELLEVLLRKRGIEASRINSDLSQKQREDLMRKFREGELRVLIGTDIAARGIDIKHLDLVLNYAIHDQPEIYVHRTGRTGRAGRKGRAISIVGPQDFTAFHNLTKTLTVELREISLSAAA